jgi:hypothetical protein
MRDDENEMKLMNCSSICQGIVPVGREAGGRRPQSVRSDGAQDAPSSRVVAGWLEVKVFFLPAPSS